MGFLADAIKALKDEKIKALLSMLGIVISIVAVISIHIVGKGITETMKNMVHFNKGGTNIELSINLEDSEINDNSEDMNNDDFFELDSPIFTDAAMNEFEIRMKQEGLDFQRDDEVRIAEVQYETDNRKEEWNLCLNACSNKHAEEAFEELQKGEVFSEENATAAVAIIPLEFAKVYFGTEDPIGKRLQIIGDGIYENLEVIGVYEEGISKNESQINEATIYLPIEYCRNRGYDLDSDDSTITYNYKGETEPAQIKQLISSFWNNQPSFLDNNYKMNISFFEEDVNYIEQGIQILVWIITGIGGLAFFIGGINIIQMMTIFVEEKAFEISIKKALGAKNYNIYSEVYIQAFLIVFGGILVGTILGCLLGYGIHYKIAKGLEQSNISFFFYFPWKLILAAGVAAILLSIIASIMPIQKVRKMEICEILRNIE